MTYPKLLSVFALILFGAIALMALFKNNNAPKERPPTPYALSGVSHAVELETEIRPIRKVNAASREQLEKKRNADLKSAPIEQASTEIALPKTEAPLKKNPDISSVQKNQDVLNVREPGVVEAVAPKIVVQEKVDLSPPPEADRIAELFNKGEPKLSFVETIVYKSTVAWHKGKPAWISDYANYYSTSRHFIARSLNGMPDYLKQDVSNGDRFNVFRKDKNIHFYLLIDISRLKMWFYALDIDTDERILLKTYKAGLGRQDKSKASGYLTPIGKYQLGSKVAIYQPGVEGHYKGAKVEMMRVFGSRWIPFEKEISNCSEPAKGFGIHGVPWLPGADGSLVEEKASIGKYESDGCIRLSDPDVKEVFAIIVSKPTTIELVKDFHDAKLPGTER